MKKIVGIIHPFDMLQTFYVYEDENRLKTLQTKIEDIPNVIFNLVTTYDIDQIDLSGARNFNAGLVKQFEDDISKYSKHKIIIKYI